MTRDKLVQTKVAYGGITFLALAQAQRISPLGDIACLVGEPHQPTLDFNANVEGQQDVKTAWFAARRHCVAECQQGRKHCS